MFSVTANSDYRRIRLLQAALNAAGYRCPTDGRYDLRTRDAVRGYQLAASVEATGVCSDDLFAEIVDGKPAAADPQPVEKPVEKSVKKPVKKAVKKSVKKSGSVDADG